MEKTGECPRLLRRAVRRPLHRGNFCLYLMKQNIVT